MNRADFLRDWAELEEKKKTLCRNYLDSVVESFRRDFPAGHVVLHLSTDNYNDENYYWDIREMDVVLERGEPPITFTGYLGDIDDGPAEVLAPKVEEHASAILWAAYQMEPYWQFSDEDITLPAGETDD